VDGLERLLLAHAGADRARQLGGAFDTALDERMSEAGWYSVVGSGTGDEVLAAVLAVQSVARALGDVTAGASVLVGPALGLPRSSGPLPILDAGGRGRFADVAERALQLDGGTVLLCRLDAARSERLTSAYGQSLGRAHVLGREPLDVPAERFLALWRLVLAAEASGLMSGALDLVLQHMATRKQFGRPLGQFQALRHRVAEAFVLVEGARLLTCEAAWLGAPDEAAAKAAALSATAARRVVREAHQLLGAMGLTREYDLHLWTLRLHAVSLEAGGRRAHARAAAQAHLRRTAQDGRGVRRAS
jgi:hypothetical protein